MSGRVTAPAGGPGAWRSLLFATSGLTALLAALLLPSLLRPAGEGAAPAGVAPASTAAVHAMAAPGTHAAPAADDHSAAHPHKVQAPPEATLAALDTRSVRLPDEEAQRLVPRGLVDQTGAPFPAERLAGAWSLVFAGYTSCPHVCPMTLRLLSDYLAAVAEGAGDGAAPARVVFLTVDPAHDTPAVMRDYLAPFAHGITGLTGPAGAVDDFVAQLRAGYRRAPDGLTIDHSTSLFAVAPDGRLAGLILTYADAAAIAHELDRLRAAFDGAGPG